MAREERVSHSCLGPSEYILHGFRLPTCSKISLGFQILSGRLLSPWENPATQTKAFML